MSAPQPLPSRLIGALFVERGLVSESQIRIALEIQADTGQQLGQVLVERFGVSRKELASVVAEQWAKLGGSAGPEDVASWRRLGDIFVDRGFVTQEELDQALTRQRQTGERLGEALVAQGVISKFELAGALAEQMAELGDEKATDEPAQLPPEATVHHLPTRDVDPELVPFGAVIELAAGGAAAELALPDADDEPALEEIAAVAPEDTGDAMPDEAPAAAFADVAEVLPLEPEVEVEEPEPERAEPVPAEVGEAVSLEPEVEVWEPEQAESFPAEGYEAVSDDVSVADDDLHPDPAFECLAFAPTTSGYRLVPLDAEPAPGETIDIPDIGERLVLRIGSSPLPGDDRPCAYTEELVTSALAEAVVH